MIDSAIKPLGIALASLLSALAIAQTSPNSQTPSIESLQKQLDAAKASQAHPHQAAASGAKAASRPQPRLQVEDEAWALCREAKVAVACDDYLSSYPKGRFAKLALTRLTELKAMSIQSEPASASIVRPAEPVRSASDAKSARTDSLATVVPRVPPRPNLQIPVAENVWSALESSEAYLNLPKPRRTHVHFISNELITKSNWLLPDGHERFTEEESIDSDAISDKCSRIKVVRSESGPYARSGTTISEACLIEMNVTGTIRSETTKLNSVTGGLFPMKMGARLNITYSISRPGWTGPLPVKRDCEVVESISAASVLNESSGAAWRIHCTGEFNGNSSEADDYYLEDSKIMLSEIGVYDFSLKRFVVPKTGESVTGVNSNPVTYAVYEYSIR